MFGGSIPVLHAKAQGLAEAWELSLLRLYDWNCEIRTEYDQKDEDGNWLYPPSVDATMMVTVTEPSSEPAIHRAFPGGLEDLEEYRMEVVEGVKDHWAQAGREADGTKWEYTYHERLTEYACFGATDKPEPLAGVKNLMPVFKQIDQLDDLVRKLAKSPISRRVQAITWQPWKDPNCFDPPCLQSIWCRILPDENDVWHLNMNVRFRSRDAYDAAFMNMWALVCLQEELAKQLAEKASREVRLGHYCDLSDSYHIYGRRREHFETGFLKLVNERTFEDRTWTREFVQPFFDEARPKIRAKIEAQDEEWRKQ